MIPILKYYIPYRKWKLNNKNNDTGIMDWIDFAMHKRGWHIEQNKYGTSYTRKVNDTCTYTAKIAISHKASRKHIIQSYDPDLFDEKLIGNTCVGIEFPEYKLLYYKVKLLEKKWRNN